MLEMLLMQYEFQFETLFPLSAYTEKTEIELINLLYYCVQNNDPDPSNAPAGNLFPNAPGQSS